MASVSFCRICLITGVKMELLEDTDIERFISTNGSPLSACYECTIIIRKVNVLLNKYATSQAILENILQMQDQITEEELKSIDRKSLMLESNLECCKRPLIISFDTTPDRDLTEESKERHETIKEAVQKEKSGIPKDFKGNSLIKITMNECEETETLGDADKIEVTDSANDISLKDEIINIIDGECNGVNLLEMLDNCDNSDNLLERVDIIIEKLNDDVDKIVGKTRKPRVPKHVKKKKGPENKLYLLEDMFEITELTRNEQIRELSKRKESIYYMNNLYKCELCFRGFNHNSTYQTHLKLTHDPGIGPSKCPVCNCFKKSNMRLNQHIREYHKYLFKCKKCDFVSSMRSRVDRHKKWHEGAVYNCKFCGESFDNNMTKLSHERIKHPSEFLCDLCGLPFLSQPGIRAHKRMAHFDHKVSSTTQAQLSVGVNVNLWLEFDVCWTPEARVCLQKSSEEADPQLYCEVCKIQFATSEAWQTHLQKSSKHNPHKKITGPPTPQPWEPVCRYCGLRCKDREELRAHHSAKHRNKPKTSRSDTGLQIRRSTTTTDQAYQYPMQCHYCDLVVTSKGQHYSHHKSIHSDKPYKQGDFVCDACGKTFLSKTALSLHIESRHNALGKRFECDHCHLKFASKMYLSMHVQRHLYPKNLCSICGKVFKSKGYLKTHIRNVHGGSRPHKCGFCQKTFVMGSVLKVHVNEVHLGMAKKRIRIRKKANA